MSTSSGSGPASADYDRFDQLAEEFAERHRRGERPSLQEYIDRCPELADEIRQLFPAMIEVERAEGDQRATAEGAPAPPPMIGQVGDYRILREVGRGGMGVVYEAEQISLGRRVALKILPRQVAQDRKTLARFRREARSAAGLHHTNIVPVYEVGKDGDTSFYAMQFIQGQALDSVIHELRRIKDHARPIHAGSTKSNERGSNPDRGLNRMAQSILTGRFAAEAGDAPATESHAGTNSDPGDGSTEKAAPSALCPAEPAPAHSSAVMPGGSQISTVDSGRRPFFRSVAQIGRQVAAGLAYAHARGIVHRDVKPSNLMLDTEGVVWITDFGLAKATDDGLTQTGDIVGTLRYMAPERFRGEGDGRADVFALGLTLYELVTLRAAFDSPDRLKLIEQIKSADPPRPRSLDPRIPRDLETIILKAIDKEPKARYASAEAMAEDLRRFIDDEPILARRDSLAEKVTRSARRNPVIASLAVVLFSTLLVTTIASLLAANRMRRLVVAEKAATRTAQAEREVAEAARRAEADSRKVASRREAEARATLDFFVKDMLAAAKPENRLNRTPTIDDMLAQADKSIAGRFADQPLIEASIRHALAETYHAIGQEGKAEPHARRAWELRQKLQGSDSPDTLQTACLLGDILSRLNQRYFETRLVVEPVFRARLRTLGPDHPDTAAAMSAFADSIHNFPSRVDEGRALFDRAIPVLRRAYGPADGRTIEAMIRRAWTSRVQGKFAECMALYDEILELQRQSLGPDHFQVGRVLEVRALNLEFFGKLEEAAEVYDEAVRIACLVPDPAYGWAQVSIGGATSLRMGQAEAETRRAGPAAARAIYEKALPVCNLGVSRAEAHLAREPNDREAKRILFVRLRERFIVLRELGRLGEALKDIDRSLPLYESLFGKDDGGVVRIPLALTLAHLNRPDDAAQAIAPVEGGQPPPDVLVHVARVFTLAAVASSGDPDRAGYYADRAMRMLRRAVAEGCRDVETLRTNPEFASLRGRGDFRSLLVDAAMPVDPFRKAHDELELTLWIQIKKPWTTSRSVSSLAKLRAENDRLLMLGYRPTCITSSTEAFNSPTFAATWTADKKPVLIKAYAERDHFREQARNIPAGYRPAWLAVDESGATPRWTGIWVKDEVAVPWTQRDDLSPAEVLSENDRLRKAGYRPSILVSHHGPHGATRYTGVWVKDGVAARVFFQVMADEIRRLHEVMPVTWNPCWIDGMREGGRRLYTVIAVEDGERPEWSLTIETPDEADAPRPSEMDFQGVAPLLRCVD